MDFRLVARRSTAFLAVCGLCVAATLIVPASALASLGITLRGATGSTNNAVNSLVLTMPASVASGDVLVAQVAVRGGTGTTITKPSGWTFIREEDGNTSTLAQALYYRVAGSSEPSSYTWNFSSAQSAAGGIAAYIGVDTTNPVETSSGQASSSNGTTITAPSVTTSTANDMILGFYSTGKNQVISTPTGMSEHYDVTPGTSIEASEDDVLQASAGASGNKVATVSGNAAWVGQLVALKPACTGGSLSLTAPSSASFSALTLNGTNQTVSTTVVLTPDDETGNASGWNVTGTSTTFNDGSGHNLSTSATAVTGASSAAATGNCALPTNSITYSVTLPAGSSPPTAVKLYNAAANTGEGPTNVTLTFQLAVPANSYRGTYTSTWTFAIVSGP